MLPMSMFGYASAAFILTLWGGKFLSAVHNYTLENICKLKPIIGSLSLPIIVCPPLIEQLANFKTSVAPEVTCSKSLEFISEFENGSCKIIKAEISLELIAIISLIA